MKRISLALVLTAGLAVPCTAATAAPASAAAHGTYLVTSAADGGAGSLRAGLEAGYSRFVVAPALDTIAVGSTLTYDDTAELSIVGNDVTLAGDHLGTDLLLLTQGADVTLRDLTLTDGGGYEMTHVAVDGEDEGDAAGLHLVIPATATGTVDLTLDRVTVDGVAGHGVHVDDNADSAASVDATVRDSTVVDAGFGAFDRDGIRIDETGAGDIVWSSSRSTFTANGADGVELDERGEGSAHATSTGDHYTDNGGYCLPLSDRADEEGLACVEDGELDLDDGIDIDEADTGSIVSTFRGATVTGNLDEGLDWDEAGAGDVVSRVSHSALSGNGDEGHKITEEAAGSVSLTLTRVVVDANRNNDGVQVEEAGDGDVTVALDRVTVTNQANGDGVKVDEEDDGNLAMTVRGSAFGANDGQDIDVKQADAGTGWISIVRSGEVDLKAKGIETR